MIKSIWRIFRLKLRITSAIKTGSSFSSTSFLILIQPVGESNLEHPGPAAVFLLI